MTKPRMQNEKLKTIGRQPRDFNFAFVFSVLHFSLID